MTNTHSAHALSAPTGPYRTLPPSCRQPQQDGVWILVLYSPHLHNPPKPVPDVRGYSIQHKVCTKYTTQSPMTSDASFLVCNINSMIRTILLRTAPYSTLTVFSADALTPTNQPVNQAADKQPHSRFATLQLCETMSNQKHKLHVQKSKKKKKENK